MRRGCVQDLDRRSKHLCLIQSDTCKTCFGNDCNERAHIQKCYTTNGEIDVSTEASSLNSIKVCKSYNDVCFTLVNHGKTILRDCLSEYSDKNNLQINFLTEFHNKTDYYMCSSPLCNDRNITPTFCLQCDSNSDANCPDPSTDEWKKDAKHQCPFELTPSGCYHFIEGTHIRRGCIAELDDDKRKVCESDGDLCKKCIGDQCNDKTRFQKCLHYDELNSNVTESKTCPKYLDECFARIAGESIHRGCVSDLIRSMPSQSASFLSDGNEKGVLKICSGTDNCNDKQIENEHCIVCDDAKDCKNNPTYSMRQKCPMTLEKMGCYLLEKGIKSHFKRGCMSKLDSKEKEDCQSGKGHCKMCDGDSCNIKRTFQTCHVCDTEVDGENCVGSPELIKEKVCPKYLDECYTLVKDEVVKRNCIGDSIVPTVGECKENAENCRHCSDSSPCNDEVIIPEICIACDSDTDNNCKTNLTSIDTCHLSLQSKGCFHFINQTTGAHKRGKQIFIEFFCLDKRSFEYIFNNELFH